MPVIYLGVGSNMGDRQANLDQAIGLLKNNPGLADFELSKLYETSPVGFLAQNDFVNGVIKAYTNLTPRDVLQLCQDVEKKLKRQKTVRFGPRNIDVDLLFYDARIICEGGLEIPHPRAHLRLFVLKPMCDLAPDYEHPILHKTMAELLAELDDTNQIIKDYQ